MTTYAKILEKIDDIRNSLKTWDPPAGHEQPPHFQALAKRKKQETENILTWLGYAACTAAILEYLDRQLEKEGLHVAVSRCAKTCGVYLKFLDTRPGINVKLTCLKQFQDACLEDTYRKSLAVNIQSAMAHTGIAAHIPDGMVKEPEILKDLLDVITSGQEGREK